ncbi:hypothetical protein, partial [Escherichia coli]|uniref:hypothetical protein n=1 Tax=Escherichia coli TaxID=562 RepID=UPI0028E09DD8
LHLALAKMPDEREGMSVPGLSEHDRQVIARHERAVAAALPIGSSMAHRMVQDAVADFLKARSRLSFKHRRELHDKTRQSILEALGKNFDEIR